MRGEDARQHSLICWGTKIRLTHRCVGRYVTAGAPREAQQLPRKRIISMPGMHESPRSHISKYENLEVPACPHCSRPRRFFKHTLSSARLDRAHWADKNCGGKIIREQKSPLVPKVKLAPAGRSPKEICNRTHQINDHDLGQLSFCHLRVYKRKADCG